MRAIPPLDLELRWRLRRPRYWRIPWALSFLLEPIDLELYALREEREAPSVTLPWGEIEDSNRWWRHRGPAAIAFIGRGVRGMGFNQHRGQERLPTPIRGPDVVAYSEPERVVFARFGIGLAAHALREEPAARLRDHLRTALDRAADSPDLPPAIRALAKGVRSGSLRPFVPQEPPSPDDSSARACGDFERELLTSAGITWLTRSLRAAGLEEPDRHDRRNAFVDALAAQLTRALVEFPTSAAERWNWFLGRFPWGDWPPSLAAMQVNLGVACLVAAADARRRPHAVRGFLGLAIHQLRLDQEPRQDREPHVPGWTRTWDDLLADFLRLDGLDAQVRALALEVQRFPESAARDVGLRLFYALVDATPHAEAPTGSDPTDPLLIDLADDGASLRLGGHRLQFVKPDSSRRVGWNSDEGRLLLSLCRPPFAPAAVRNDAASHLRAALKLVPGRPTVLEGRGSKMRLAPRPRVALTLRGLSPPKAGSAD